eukprot:997089-Prymnesium_polylepis.2
MSELALVLLYLCVLVIKVCDDSSDARTGRIRSTALLNVPFAPHIITILAPIRQQPSAGRAVPSAASTAVSTARRRRSSWTRATGATRRPRRRPTAAGRTDSGPPAEEAPMQATRAMATAPRATAARDASCAMGTATRGTLIS